MASRVLVTGGTFLLVWFAWGLEASMTVAMP